MRTGPEAASGAQPERTRLAWDRTTFALAAVAALLVRIAEPLGAVTAAVLIPAAFALRVLAAARYRRARAAVRTGTLRPEPALMAAASIAATVLSVACAVAVLLDCRAPGRGERHPAGVPPGRRRAPPPGVRR